MKLRHPADFRTLFWAFGLFPLAPTLAYAFPELALYLTPVGLYLGFCAGVLIHNQNHSAVFVSRRANAVYSLWLSVFYGLPIFTWLPTHNQNHHRYTNGAGDATRTSAHSERNTLWNAVTYPWLSVRAQLAQIADFVRRARRRNPQLFKLILAQTAVVPGVHGALLALAMGLHGPRLGALTYLFAVGLPALYAPWSMMFVNYLQHVHCDPLSPHNHSRNFVSPLSNWLFFQNGYHTVHHEHPGEHWSRYAALHRVRAAAIEPALNQHSMLGFCVQSYLLGCFSARYRTQQMGEALPSTQTPLLARGGVTRSLECQSS